MKSQEQEDIGNGAAVILVAEVHDGTALARLICPHCHWRFGNLDERPFEAEHSRLKYNQIGEIP